MEVARVQSLKEAWAKRMGEARAAKLDHIAWRIIVRSLMRRRVRLTNTSKSAKIVAVRASAEGEADE